MRTNLLILGGTTEASALVREVSAQDIDATLSLAGRVERPKPVPIPRRVGGFGGVAGLADYIAQNQITHLIDATHPFANKMSQNAVQAAAKTGVPLAALTRPEWAPQQGDKWLRCADMEAAVTILATARRRRIMLAIGRQNLPMFGDCAQHFFLLRLVDPPETPVALPDHHAIIDRGPFSLDGDLTLLKDHQIDLVVSKNAGGTASRAKLDAARALGIEVLMIDRPAQPMRTELHSVQDALDWVAHSATERGV